MSLPTVSLISADRRVAVAVFAAALALAALLARPRAESWNVASRLATIESLVDFGTLAIDRSTFASTGDKIRVGGHYFSDKPLTPAVLLVPAYRVWRGRTGESAATDPEGFARAMAVVSSGLSYALSCALVWLIGRRVGLSATWAGTLAGTFALGTVAVAYAQSANQHSLALACGCVWGLWLVGGCGTVLAGTAVGLAYAADQSVGLPLVAVSAAFALSSRPGLRGCLTLAGCALPWMVLHHALNFVVGGTLAPANANPAYLVWPGSTFHAGNMTGVLQQHSFAGLLSYASELLVGKKGFLVHNPPLFVVAFALMPLWRTLGRDERRLLAACLAWPAAVWGLSILFSNNASGACLSVRWFVPLLAPGFVLLAFALKHVPAVRPGYIVLTGGGFLLGLHMAVAGPWTQRMLPGFWAIVGTSLVGAAGVTGLVWRSRRAQTPGAGGHKLAA